MGCVCACLLYIFFSYLWVTHKFTIAIQPFSKRTFIGLYLPSYFQLFGLKTPGHRISHLYNGKKYFERSFWRVDTGALGFHHITESMSHTHTLQERLHRYKTVQCRAQTLKRVTSWLHCLLHYIFFFLLSTHCELSNRICSSAHSVIPPTICSFYLYI